MLTSESDHFTAHVGGTFPHRNKEFLRVIKSYWHYNILSLGYKLLICMSATAQLGWHPEPFLYSEGCLGNYVHLWPSSSVSPRVFHVQRDGSKPDGREGQSRKLLHHM